MGDKKPATRRELIKKGTVKTLSGEEARRVYEQPRPHVVKPKASTSASRKPK